MSYTFPPKESKLKLSAMVSNGSTNFLIRTKNEPYQYVHYQKATVEKIHYQLKKEKKGACVWTLAKAQAFLDYNKNTDLEPVALNKL